MDKFVTVSLFQFSSRFCPGCNELTGYFCYYWFLTTLQLFKYMLALSRLTRLYSLLSSASEMIPPHASAVKRFFYEINNFIKIQAQSFLLRRRTHKSSVRLSS